MIIDKIRNLEEFKKLYQSRPMPIQYDFDWLVNNPQLYCFYDEKEGFLRGFITIQREQTGELTLSGTSIRKNYQDNIDAINTICNAYNEDIYAYSALKEAGIVLKKAGFKKLDNKDNTNRYVRLKDYGKQKQSA